MKIPVSEPFVGEKEIENVVDALKTGWISGLKGKYLDQFESNFSKYCNASHGIACSSGTASLQVATRVLNIGPGDEVIVPTFTNIASVLCIYYNGAKPVLVDVDPNTWCMNLDLVNNLITPKTKAILPVHIYGHPVDMDKVNQLAKENNLFVIEDCAEGHGAKVRGKTVGGLSDISCFSFYSNKIISTGEGGMLLTSNDEYARKAKQYVTLAFSEKNRYNHEYLAYNFRLSNVLAAIGVAQLEQIDNFVDKKRWIANEYNKRLKDLDGIQIPTEKEWAKNVYWMYGIVLNEKFPLKRDELMEFLSSNGVDSRSFFVPMHNQTVFHNKGLFINEKHPESERISKNGLYLPCSNKVTEDQIEYICNIIKKTYEN
jgi:perosamine synthetase